MIDLQQAFLPAARAVLHGHSPYDGAYARFDLIRSAYVYPPPVAVLVIPLAGFSAPVAGVLFTALTVVATVGAVWLLGVRDPRCYAITLAAHPVVMGELVGAVSGFVLLGLAAAWRWRDSRAIASCAIGITLAAKMFCWPVVLWLLVTRRIAAGAFSVWIALVVVMGTWAAIGFAGLRGYLHLLAYVTSHEAADSYSPAGLLHTAGVPLAVGEGVAVGAALLLMATVVGGAVTMRSCSFQRSRRRWWLHRWCGITTSCCS